MKRLRRAVAGLLCAALFCTTLSGCQSAPLSAASTDSTEVSELTADDRATIALMPLDSRPCNTQYPQLLTQAAGATLVMPSEASLDHFLEEADTDALWTWLEDAAESADHLVIFTNSLFCGGLIASRSSGAYDDLSENIARLQTLCEDFQRDNERTITVVQVLPRLKPNQYDTDLYPYGNALTSYGRAWDEADIKGEAAPTSAEDVPDDVLNEYRTLHERSADLAEALNTMAADGLIDSLIISQDDGDVRCPANVTFRALKKHKAETTRLVHGADELAMLLVTDLATRELEPTPIQVIYSSEESKKEHYPYESTNLQTMAAQKIALTGLKNGDETSDYTLYIHARSEDADKTLAAIADHDGVLGIADVALSNQADPLLADTLLSAEGFEQVDAYAGWNTAGNAIGTVCAMLRVYAYLDANWDDLPKEVQLTSAKALFAFRAIRLGEDVCYMADLRTDLQEELIAADLCDDTSASAFGNDADWTAANSRLEEAYTATGAKLEALLNGTHVLHLGNHAPRFTIQDFSSSVGFPWARAFEIRIEPQMAIAAAD